MGYTGQQLPTACVLPMSTPVLSVCTWGPGKDWNLQVHLSQPGEWQPVQLWQRRWPCIFMCENFYTYTYVLLAIRHNCKILVSYVLHGRCTVWKLQEWLWCQCAAEQVCHMSWCLGNAHHSTKWVSSLYSCRVYGCAWLQIFCSCSSCGCSCIDWLVVTDEYIPHLAIPMCILLAGGCA